ncbi:Sushi, von Willebrand factor type A, EGF and pentraxin domain-containing protein 1 [Stylophora pistillata]|uniref:Sushi, von Willebrand factor type A, EGF and pentraxin domain-containing protein 1 n=1 Tax=Stylophora pistillata TaxID=50429 RepID=A0A2B4RFA7_STYPI|nr:Sushi, von Willebrand factor type A, EGF and pentraxin domain-containing protein 1 [Stylophora pistillata]
MKRSLQVPPLSGDSYDHLSRDVFISPVVMVVEKFPPASTHVQKDQCRILAFPSTLFFVGERLVNHSIANISVIDRDTCEHRCYLNHNCVSINFYFGPSDAQNCELNNSTSKEHEKDLVKAANYVYHGTKNACGRAPCFNNAICQSGFTSKRYRCICSVGFSGPHCEQDIDECAKKTHECNANAECHNTMGSFTCKCKPGYVEKGQQCEGISGCAQNPCHHGGTCTNEGDKYKCTCLQGFTGAHCETGYIKNSNILSKNESYFAYLREFLVPAVGNDSYWLLCYRASSHGWAGRVFHARCDGKKNIVTIIQKDQYVFGGYTDIPWDHNPYRGYRKTEKAFIYSIKNKEGLMPFKSMVRHVSQAIYMQINYGATFGGGFDIHIADYAGYNTNSYARLGHTFLVPNEVKEKDTVLAGSLNFTPDEVEVFYLP